MQSKLWKILQHGNLEELKALSDKMPWETFLILLQTSHRRSGDTAVHMSSRHNQLDMLIWLHEACHLQLEILNLEGKTPLHEAASTCNHNIVKYLLSCGVNVDPLKRAGWTPLMMAATKVDNLTTVNLLIDFGAKIELVNKVSPLPRYSVYS